MRAIPEGAVFSAEQAYSLGWTQSALRHAVVRGRLLRLRRGFYAVADAATPEIAARAVAANYPAGVVSHRSAALLQGIPIVGALPAVPEITVPPGSTRI